MSIRSLPQRGQRLSRLHTTFAAVTLASLTACGGSGDDSASPAGSATPVPTPVSEKVTLTGTVAVIKAVKGATVCLDLNASKACDADEPTSAVTGADGAYSITYDTATLTKEKAAAAALVAAIPTTAVDANDAAAVLTTTAYVLTAPAGKTAQVNPLTTLVQTGVAAGMKLADAEAAVAVQLGVSASDLYDYQANTQTAGPLNDNPQTVASIVNDALVNGVAVNVTPLADSSASASQLASLTYTDASNYYIRTFANATDGKDTGIVRTSDTRAQLSKGVALADSVLFANVYLTPKGWVRCDATGFDGTRGRPTRSAFCGGGQQSAGYTVETNIAGKNMGEVIRGMQAATDGSNTITMDSTLVNNAVFPDGATLNTRKNTLLRQHIWVNNINSTNELLTGANYASVETLIKARQVANVKLAPKANSGLTWLGLTEDNNHWLAGAFTDEVSGVQYYSCTFVADGSNYDTCAEAGKGSFTIVTQDGVRLIKFSGQPNPVSTASFTVGYGEYAAGTMVRFREVKPDTTYTVTRSARLNGTAWDALRKALSL